MLRIKSFLSAPSHPYRHFRRGVLRTSCQLMATLSLLLCTASQAVDITLFRPLTPETASLNQYQWQYRPVVIFAPSETDLNYVHQMAMLEKSKAELAERDIIVLSDTSHASKGHLRAQLKPAGFEVVLIGKDGGMKIRETKPISSEDLLSTIDRMPMRKANLD